VRRDTRRLGSVAFEDGTHGVILVFVVAELNAGGDHRGGAGRLG
jgi:hypothetical protein